MTNPFYLWKVRYSVRFASSSGMQPYESITDHEGHVFTMGESLSDVKAEIQKTLCNQSTVSALKEAHFLGTTINRPEITFQVNSPPHLVTWSADPGA